jgi:hypothetical protein
MADTKISALPASSTPLAGTEVLPIVQSSATKQVSVANLTAGRAISAASLALTTSPLPVSSGGTGLSALGAAFSAYQNVAQTLSSNTNTLTQFESVEFDTNGCFNNSATPTTLNGLTAPAWAFVPNVGGYYQVSFAAQGGAAITRISISIQKNAATIKGLQDTSSALVSQTSGSTLIYLNGTGDYIQAYTYFSIGQAMQTTAPATWFQACFVRKI